MEAMDYEGVRCAPLLTKAFSAHIDLRARDALRDEIVDMAEKKEVDDALMAILTGNAANAEAEGDQGRAKFLYKVAEVCLREKKNAGSGSADEA